MRWVGFSLVALAVVGCGDDSTPAMDDAGPVEIDAGGPGDAGPLEMSRLFGGCVADSQCPGAGAFCRTASEGFPRGSCTLPCADRGPCDDGVVFNFCQTDPNDAARGMVCQQKCLNAQDCGREGYVCLGRTDAMDGICVGYCRSDEECGEGAECNVFSARCVAEGTAPTEGGHTGDPCANGDQCLSGTCLTTDWPGGYCIGHCVLPTGYNSNTFFSEDAYPTEQCPENNVCYPVDSLARDNAGVCLKVCDSDADCRPEYFCDKETDLSSGSTKTFTNGICFPR